MEDQDKADRGRKRHDEKYDSEHGEASERQDGDSTEQYIHSSHNARRIGLIEIDALARLNCIYENNCGLL